MGIFPLLLFQKVYVEMEVEKLIMKHIFLELDDMITTEFCGEKYKHVKEERKYARAGNYDRTIITIPGEINFKMNKVKNNSIWKIFKLY